MYGHKLPACDNSDSVIPILVHSATSISTLEVSCSKKLVRLSGRWYAAVNNTCTKIANEKANTIPFEATCTG